MAVAVAAYLALVSVATFAAFARDKRAARMGGRRTPERSLLALAALGGAPAALLACARLRHKTRKARFLAALWLIAGAQAGLLLAAAYRLAR
jgi:uncharacterized membrane protein YsdA (DUF1294 family)